MTCHDSILYYLLVGSRVGDFPFWLWRMEGGTCAPDPEDTAQFLNLLNEVGLVGSRLAVSHGSEGTLARQLAERLGLEPKPWHTTFIMGQVREAVQMADLDERLSGTTSTRSIQNLLDAKAAMEKGKVKTLEPGDTSIVVPVKPKRGTLGRTVRLRSGRVAAEDEVNDKILDKLVGELVLYKAPVLDEVKKSMNPMRAKDALLGKYRISTIRRYLASWQRFREWADSLGRPGQRPTSVTLVDYMYAREEEGMGPSIPLAVSTAVAWFERTAGTPEDEQMMSQAFPQMVMKELTRKLEQKAPPVRRAPRWLGCFVAPMETLVVDKDVPFEIRVCAWFKLIKLWGSMRFDDAAHLKMSELKFYDGQLTGMMHQSKTTGAGKRVRELPIFIARDSYVLQDDWLAVGYDLVKLQMPRERVFLFPEGCFYGTRYGTSHVSYAEAVAGSSRAFALLEGYHGPLIPSGWERFWSEHSERATLPSGLAALGVEKSSRDLLGRWCPEGSDVYVRTYNTIVKKMQQKIVAVLRGEAAYEVLDEGSIMEELKTWLHEKWTVPEDQAEKVVEAWKDKLGVRGRPPATVQVSDEDTTIYDGSQSEKEMGDLGEKDPKKRRTTETLEEEREGNYVVVYRRAGRGTLHRLGAKGCWMAKKRLFVRSEVHEELPEPEEYTLRCKLCWGGGSEPLSESTSDSRDELSLSD